MGNIDIYDLTCSIEFSGVNTMVYLAIFLLVGVKAESSRVGECVCII